MLIAGPSGSGKSDLALRLLDRGFTLVSDDRTIVRKDGDRLIASAPETIKGKLEIRGIGIVDMETVPDVPVALVVELTSDIQRLPDDSRERLILGSRDSADQRRRHDRLGPVQSRDRARPAWPQILTVTDAAQTLPRLLLVTGMSGAGKSTVLDALEDMGWDCVDNLPTALLKDFVHGEREARQQMPVAVGMDVRSRGFDPRGAARPAPLDRRRHAGNPLPRLRRVGADPPLRRDPPAASAGARPAGRRRHRQGARSHRAAAPDRRTRSSIPPT